MCELLGISSQWPVDFRMSFGVLAMRGGRDGRLADGWGLGCYDGHDVRLLREPEAANDSPWVRLVDHLPMRASIVVAHVRHATQGDLSLANTQPLTRELGGRAHLFSHNGDLQGLPAIPFDAPYRPIGSTDSERAMCVLLGRMSSLWRRAAAPSIDERFAVVHTFVEQMRALGPANFLYSDGELLFAHSHERRAPEGGGVGLWRVQRSCDVGEHVMQGQGIRLQSSGRANEVTVVASVPVTDEAWEPLPAGALLALRGGTIVRASGYDGPGR